MFIFCACSKQNSSSANAVNFAITSKICEIEDYQNLSDETIKALAVVFRTNLKNGENYSFNKNAFDKNILSLVRDTKKEVIEDVDESILFEDNKEWTKEISKSKILETFSLNGENISSFENISLEKDSVGKVSNLYISQKVINKRDLKNSLGLKSNFITDLKTTPTSIIFYGKGNSFGEKFDILRAEEISKKNESYEAIIKYFKNGYKTIK